MKKNKEKRDKKYRPSTSTLSGIKTTWGRALMIDYSFMSADPYKNPVKFKYNRRIRDVIINAESDNKQLPRHEFSKICSEIMFKCESESNNKNKKESRFDINLIVMAVLSSKVSAFPVKNPDGQAYHTSIVSIINITTLSISEIDFLKVAFAGHIDYEIGTVSAEVLYSELDPNEQIVKNYVNATPIIMINHIKDVVRSQAGSFDLSDEVSSDIAEYTASLNIDKNEVAEITDGVCVGEHVSNDSDKGKGIVNSIFTGNKMYSVAMLILICVLVNRIFYHIGMSYGLKETFSTIGVVLGLYIIKRRISKKESSNKTGVEKAV